MPSKPGFFVTGTDTEVGKTLVSGALILKLQEQFNRVGAYKPVVAGLQEINGQLQNEDLMNLYKRLWSKVGATVSKVSMHLLQTPTDKL